MIHRNPVSALPRRNSAFWVAFPFCKWTLDKRSTTVFFIFIFSLSDTITDPLFEEKICCPVQDILESYPDKGENTAWSDYPQHTMKR